MKIPPTSRIESRYANLFKVGFNAFEFVLDFGQTYGEAGNAEAHTRLTVIPVLARAWSGALADAVNRYEREFGPIPQVDHDEDDIPGRPGEPGNDRGGR